MVRFIVTAIILIVSFVLQGTVFSYFSFGGVVPNLVLIYSTSIGLMRGQKAGIITGFFAGLLLDIFSGSYIGFYALLLMYLGFYAGTFNKAFYAEDIKLPIFVILSGDIIYGFVNYIFILLLKGKTNMLYYFKNIAVPECIYTIVITIVFYPFILFINKKLEKNERKQAKQVGQQD